MTVKQLEAYIGSEQEDHDKAVVAAVGLFAGDAWRRLLLADTFRAFKAGRLDEIDTAS